METSTKTNCRTNLVIVRAGDCSLHSGWLDGKRPREWDLLVNYFGDDPRRFREPGVPRIDSKGPKWPALKALLSEHANELSKYEYVFMPDDDLECDGDGINRFFDLCVRFKLILAQPSLSLDSFVAHAITIHQELCLVRFTNYVEIMAPCFHRSALDMCLHTFDENLSGWGLEVLWQQILSQQTGRIGIVDAVQIKHTRPVLGPNYEHLKRQGVLPQDELLTLLAKHSLKRPILKNLSVVDLFGHEHGIDDFAEYPNEWLTVPWGKIV